MIEFTSREEENAALALVPAMKEIADFVKSRIPEGTHWGVLMIVGDRADGRIVALTSDRDIVADAAGAWAVDVMDRR